MQTSQTNKCKLVEYTIVDSFKSYGVLGRIKYIVNSMQTNTCVKYSKLVILCIHIKADLKTLKWLLSCNMHLSMSTTQCIKEHFMNTENVASKSNSHVIKIYMVWWGRATNIIRSFVSFIYYLHGLVTVTFVHLFITYMIWWVSKFIF